MSIYTRISEAKEFIQKNGKFKGETRRDAIINHACLDLEEEIAADINGWLPKEFPEYWNEL